MKVQLTKEQPYAVIEVLDLKGQLKEVILIEEYSYKDNEDNYKTLISAQNLLNR